MSDRTAGEDDPMPGEVTQKEQGAGSDGTIPTGSAGVEVGAGEPSNFEPEEDPEAAPQPDVSDDEIGGGV